MKTPENKPEQAGNKPETLPEVERKEVWLGELADFIVEANRNTWAADMGRVVPQRPGFKESYYREGIWQLRDSYTGYFRAPGMTTVYYKGKPAWTMVYGGAGMEDGKYKYTKSTFQFLRSALMHVDPKIPYRGPKHFEDGEYKYQTGINGTLEDFAGMEFIYKGKEMVFSQLIFGGVVINKDSSRQPIYPWNL